MARFLNIAFLIVAWLWLTGMIAITVLRFFGWA